jgi:hypothetical protein
MSRRLSQVPEPAVVHIPIPSELEDYLLSPASGFNPPEVSLPPAHNTGTFRSPALVKFARADCGVEVHITERGHISLINFGPKRQRLTGWWRVEYETERMPIPTEIIISSIRQAVLEYAEPPVVAEPSWVEVERTAAELRRVPTEEE